MSIHSMPSQFLAGRGIEREIPFDFDHKCVDLSQWPRVIYRWPKGRRRTGKERKGGGRGVVSLCTMCVCVSNIL